MQEAGLLDVERKLIPLSVDRPRKIYRVTGAALPLRLLASAGGVGAHRVGTPTMQSRFVATAHIKLIGHVRAALGAPVCICAQR